RLRQLPVDVVRADHQRVVHAQDGLDLARNTRRPRRHHGPHHQQPGGARPMTRTRHAFTLVEAVLSTVIIATLFAASLRLVAASRIGQIRSADRVRGMLLASALMSEIQSQRYSEPTEAPVLGIEASELLSGRAAWDDV